MLKCIRVLFALVIAAAVVAPHAEARRPNQSPTISFDTGPPAQPVGGAGKITATGTYVLGNPAQALSGVYLVAIPTGGGMRTTNLCASGGGSWSGLIAGLPAGSYSVYAELRTLVNGQEIPWDSAIANNIIVTAP